MSRRGREALGEEDVSQHRRELEQWVEEKKKEKRETKVGRAFSLPFFLGSERARWTDTTGRRCDFWHCVFDCVRARVRACTSSSCVTSASVMGGTPNAGRFRLCSL